MATISYRPTRDGRGELQYELKSASGAVVTVDPMPDIGWAVIREGVYVGDVMPVTPGENWKVTPLEIKLNKSEVVSPMKRATATANQLYVMAEYPSMVASFLERML